MSGQAAIYEFTCDCGKTWTAAGQHFGTSGSCATAALECPACKTFTGPARKLLVLA